MAPSVESSSFC